MAPGGPPNRPEPGPWSPKPPPDSSNDLLFRFFRFSTANKNRIAKKTAKKANTHLPTEFASPTPPQTIRAASQAAQATPGTPKLSAVLFSHHKSRDGVSVLLFLRVSCVFRTPRCLQGSPQGHPRPSKEPPRNPKRPPKRLPRSDHEPPPMPRSQKHKPLLRRRRQKGGAAVSPRRGLQSAAHPVGWSRAC